jgi:tetratricopeptide (TPR) repeat protein
VVEAELLTAMTLRNFNRILLGVVVLASMSLAGCSGLRRAPSDDDRVLRHVVQPDETLEDLADDYYGNTRRAREIRRFNDIGRGDDVKPGTELRIPMTGGDMVTLQRRRTARGPYNKGLALAERGSLLDASVEFREAVELDPRFAEACFNLGVTYQRMGAHEKALEQFRDAVGLRSENADYCYALGGSYFHLERFDRAVKEFRRALKLDPFHLKARYSFAASLEKVGKTRDARREWRKYIQLDPSSAWADKARARLDALEAQ